MRDFEEKRDYIRMVVDCEVSCTDPGDGQVYPGRAIDLSGKGICLTLEKSFAPGAELEVRIEPTQTLVPPLHARVEVVRVEPDLAGNLFRVGVSIREMLG